MTGTLCLTALLVFAALPGTPLPGENPPDSRVAKIAALFVPLADFSALCTPEFLKAVPAAKCADIVKMYTDALGKYLRAEGKEGAYTLEFEHGSCQSKISLDENGRIAGRYRESLLPIVHPTFVSGCVPTAQHPTRPIE